MLCGHDPEPWLVDELLAASSPKLPRMDMTDLQVLAEVRKSVRRSVTIMIDTSVVHFNLAHTLSVTVCSA